MTVTRNSGGGLGRLALLAPVALAVAACGSSGSAGSGGGGGTHHPGPNTVNIALADDPSSLDPQAVEDGNALAIYGNVAEPLVFRTAKDNKVTEGLATSWKSVDPKTWEFTLRKGVKFSDGEVFNADAVVFSIKRITDTNYKTEQSDWVGDITGAKKVDDGTVDITTSDPDPTVPERMSLIMMVPPTASQNADFATHPVGTGPYTMVSWSKGAKAVIQANPSYWGGKPAIDKATFQPIKEPTIRLSSLKTGEINLVSDLLPEQMSQVPQSVKTPGLEYPTVILNTRGGPFKDPNLRLAANYAIDKQALLSKLYSGFGSIANCQLMGETSFGYNPDLKPYGFDLQKAKQLIQQAGKPSITVEFVGDATGRWLKDAELEQAIQGMLQDAGFTVNIKLADFSTYLKALFPDKNDATVARPDMVFVSHDNVLGDADVTLSTYYQSTGSGASTSDPQMDTLIAQARHELDSQKRLDLYHQINKMGCDNADFIFLFNLDNVYGTTSDLNWSPRFDASIQVKSMSWK